MHTQNVNTAASESTGRWGKKIARITERGHFHVACSVEAHAHYGENFTRADACLYFIRGAWSALRNKL